MKGYYQFQYFPPIYSPKTFDICYTVHFRDNKTVDIVSVAICVRSYHLKTLLNYKVSVIQISSIMNNAGIM